MAHQKKPAAQVRNIIQELKNLYPKGLCSLEYGKDYELLFSVRLAAQCTDERVNKVTPALFARFPTLESLAGELEGIPNQGVVTPRLCRVLWTPETLTFVYQSRVRTYALSDGRLTQNRAVRRAPEASYPGVELGEKFLSR